MTMMIIVLIKSSQVMLSQIIRMDAALNDNVCRIRRNSIIAMQKLSYLLYDSRHRIKYRKVT